MEPVPYEHLVTFLSGLPDSTSKLLAQHVEDSGHCRLCHVAAPCTIRAAAQAAERIAEQQRGR